MSAELARCYADGMVLLGRPAELAQCRKALSPAGDGAAGVVITGAPGIGKIDAESAGT